MAAGSLATLAVFTLCLVASGRAIGMVLPLSRRIALGFVYDLEPLLGEAWLGRGMEWIYTVILAHVVPMAFFCFLPWVAAMIGGRVGRRVAPRQPTIAAGLGESRRDVEVADVASRRT